MRKKPIAVFLSGLFVLSGLVLPVNATTGGSPIVPYLKSPISQPPRPTPITSSFTSQAHLPNATAWYWDLDTISNDTALANDIQNMKSLRFDSIAVYDEPLVNGQYDNNFSMYRLTKVLQIAKENNMPVLPLLSATSDDNGFWGQNWGPTNTAFRSWMAEHLRAIGKAYSPYRSTIAGFVWDDIAVNTISNYTEFARFVFSNLNISKAYVQVFDSMYPRFWKINLNGNSMIVRNTMSFVYFFASVITDEGYDWTDPYWIGIAHLAAHTNPGIILDCYNIGWSSQMIREQVDYDRHLGAHIEYYAYRRGYPETVTTIYWRPVAWDTIRAVNGGLVE